MLLALVALMPASLVSCSETEEESTEFANWQERNDAYFTSVYTKAKQASDAGDKKWKVIRAYTKNPESTKPTDFVVVEVISEGTGTASPLYTDSVAIHYSGRLMPSASFADGYQFDSSWTGDYNINTMNATKGVAGSFITGFTSALQEMKDGDRWKVYIPYELGYGSSVQNEIPAYSTLVFDLTLVKSWKKRLK